MVFAFNTMPMNKKLQQELKFRIGEQYEKYEFELDWVTSVLDNNLRYEVYRYIGKDKTSMFNFEIHKILLAYNCDFLAGVFYFIRGDCCFRMLSEIQNESFYTSRIIRMIDIDEKVITIIILKKKNNMESLINNVIKLGRI